MKKNKITHDYKCQNCNAPATINLQQTLHKYDITNDGDFEEQDSWEGNDNEFYCDKCYAKIS